MQRIPVESSDVVSIGYDDKSNMLEVEFNGGRIYRYHDVEPDVHKHFMHADSYGQYFNSFINNRYKYERIKEDQSKQPEGIAFVTGNKRKVRDLELACKPYKIKIEQLNLPVDEIQSDDPADISIKKAKQAYKLAGRPVVVHDGFWNILALRGFPGAFMSYVTKWLTAEDFLRLMEGKTDRTILGTDTLAYNDGRRHKVFSQDFQGTIIHEPRGKGFFSVEQIIVLAGHTRTIAEIEDDQGESSMNPVGDKLYTPLAKWLHLKSMIKNQK